MIENLAGCPEEETDGTWKKGEVFFGPGSKYLVYLPYEVS